jgi:hypothetical protein
MTAGPRPAPSARWQRAGSYQDRIRPDMITVEPMLAAAAAPIPPRRPRLPHGPGRPHLEGLIERLGEHGEMNSHVVLSAQYEGRPVEQPDPQARPVTRSAGWSSS